MSGNADVYLHSVFAYAVMQDTLWDQHQIGEIYIIRRTRMRDSANFEPPSLYEEELFVWRVRPKNSKGF